MYKFFSLKLSDWAKSQGISYKTAWRWFNEGKLPVEAKQMATGTILIKSSKTEDNRDCVVYARVSSNDQKPDLDQQVARVVEAVTKKCFALSKVVTEIGSGLNGHRLKLKRLLSDSSVSRIAIEHKDRLMRFGYEYVESALQSQGRIHFTNSLVI
ncbi:MAG: IS607 family transposase [Pseudomonadota bacterium]